MKQPDESLYLQHIHDYFGVDLEKVWDTAKEDLPVLKAEITKIRGEL
jgi:uncharacterized protein with HEPN domain